MSEPMLSKAPDISGLQFKANFETTLEVNTTPYKEYPVSPIREVVTPTSGELLELVWFKHWCIVSQ